MIQVMMKNLVKNALKINECNVFACFPFQKDKKKKNSRRESLFSYKTDLIEIIKFFKIKFIKLPE